MNERWMVVVGFADYEVSDLGRIRRVTSRTSTRAGRILRPTIQSNGYFKVTFNGRKKRWLHRVIAEAFLGPCPQGKQVAHGDGNPAHNFLRNLTYKTPRENNQDKIAHGTQRAKLTDDMVRSIRNSTETQVKLAVRFGVHQVTISRVKRGITHVEV